MRFLRCLECGVFKKITDLCRCHTGVCESGERCIPKAGKSDNINNPSHYTQGKTETIDYIQDKLTKEEFNGFLKGNIIKYISRERLKNGLEDVKKAEYYIKKLIKVMEGENND